MTELACPKCGQVVPDRAIDEESCPLCGYDGVMIAAVRPGRAWILATLTVVFCGAALGAYLLMPGDEPIRRSGTEAVARTFAVPPSRAPGAPKQDPAPMPRATTRVLAPPPTASTPHRKNPWNPVLGAGGPIERLDARAVRERRIDAPAGAVSISDMNHGDQLTLTGVVHQLRVGSVSADAVLDASGLTAREIIITGDLSGRAEAKLHAPAGRVSLGGHLGERARLIVTAPRGYVVVQAGSGKIDGDGELTVTARSVEVNGVMAGNAKLIVTLTG